MAKLGRFFAAGVMMAALTGPAVAQNAGADTVVASVNGTEITLGHMIVLRSRLPEQYQALADDVLFNGILEQLVQQEALMQSLSPVTRRDALAVQNDTRGYLSGVALKAVVEAAVTDTALQAAYDARFQVAAPQTEYSAAHILVDTEEKALALKAEIDAGADFGDLARKHSSDGAAQSGGDLGWFGIGMMVMPFEEAVLTMKPGEVKGPGKTDFGWHLIRLNETRLAMVPSLDDMRDDLAAEIEAKAVEDHIKTLTGAAKIEKSGIGIDPALLRDETLLDK